MKNNIYSDKLAREQAWHEGADMWSHWLNKLPFHSPQRQAYNYHYATLQFYGYIIKCLYPTKSPRILIAPIGNGRELPYLEPLSACSPDIWGVDVSEKALSQIADKRVKKIRADINNLNMAEDNYFDAVIMSLFFHHFVDFGFQPFLKEAFRVLKPGGMFFSLEFSSLHPAQWISSAGRNIFGNISHLVTDERPFRPGILQNELYNAGFRDVEIKAASYSHNRTPIIAAKIINSLTKPFTETKGIRSMAWLCSFSAVKPCTQRI